MYIKNRNFSNYHRYASAGFQIVLGLKIEKEKEIMKLQGEYSVIFITFKNQKHISFENFEDGIKVLLSNLYKEHEYLLDSDKLTEFDKNDFKEIISRKASIGNISEAISSLMGYMNKHYGRKVMLFIDEYDVPIQEGYINKGNPTHIRSLGAFEDPNRRFGLSQHDVMIIPKDISKPGIIIEFKKINVLSKETIEQGKEEALKQIDRMKYYEEIINCGVEDIIKLAIVFKGKEVMISEA